MHAPPDLVLRTLFWGTLILALMVFVIIALGARIQYRSDHQNRHRIERFQFWEKALSQYLFTEPGAPRIFPSIARVDQDLFQTFLARYQATLAGPEALALRELYLRLEAHESLPKRLKHRRPTVRAQAAQEIGAFHLTDYLGQVVPLLRDPVPFVAHLAAQALAATEDLGFARLVLEWAMTQEGYQRERLLRVLEAFGPQLLPWLESNLAAPEENPEAWVLFALLAGSQRHRGSEPRLLDLVRASHVDVQASALKALAALADPLTYPKVEPLARHASWPIRAQAAKALGLIGGPDAIPTLLQLTSDPVYEVRRNAAQGLADLGHAGTAALTWLADDTTADPFARDIAMERLEWANERGHQ